MQSRITGTTMPVLEFVLDPNESVVSEAGELSWMGSSIQMTTHTQFAGGGGLFGVIKRVAGGGSIFMTEYRALGAPGEVAFATKLPGHIVPVEVGPGHEYMIHRHGFLCATPQIQISVGFQQSLGAGIFGGDGFLLQRWPRNSVAGTLRRARGPRPATGRDFARSSGSRRRISIRRVVSDHDCSGHQEHDFWRRRNLSCLAHRAGSNLAANPADHQAGPCYRPIFTASDGETNCRRRRGRRNCRLHSGWNEVSLCS